MSQYEILARSLESLATAPEHPAHKELRYVKENDGKLAEQTFDGGEWSLPVVVTTDFSSGSGATYLPYNDPEERSVVLVDSAGTLQVYKYNVEEDDWTKSGTLGSLNVKAHPKTKVTSVFDMKSMVIHVYYQNPNGELSEVQCAMTESGPNWKEVGPLHASAKAKPGTPLSPSPQAIGDQKQVHLYYVNLDGGVHYMKADYASGNSWTDEELSHSTAEKGIRQLIAGTVGDNSEGVYVLQEGGKVVIVSAASKNVEDIGSISGSVFKAATSAECCWYRPPPPCYNINVYGGNNNFYF